MPESSVQILNWDAPNGALLKRFISGLPQDRPIVLNVFGSTPLQMRLDPSFLSGDVDMFTSEDLSAILQNLKLGKEHTTPYIELVPSNIFIADVGCSIERQKKSSEILQFISRVRWMSW